MTGQTITQDQDPAKTAIHKRLQGITDAILSLAYQGAEIKNTEPVTTVNDLTRAGLADIANAIKSLQLSVTVPAPTISINISVYILLINLNIFIWWWLCRNKKDRMGCFMEQFRQSTLWNESMEEYSRKNELEKRVPAIFETPVEFIGLRAESLGESTLQEEEEDEQKWRDCASMIQDLCVEMLGSFAVESPEDRQQATLADVSQKLDTLIQQAAPPPPPPPPETFPTSARLEEQLTEETLAQALPLLHELSQVEASLTQENLDFPNLDRLEKQLEALQTKLAEHTDLFNEELARSASEPLQDNTPPVRYQRLIQLQKLRQLILQYFASNS